MKKLIVVVACSLIFSGLAFAKPAFKQALGKAACTDCHVAGKFKEAPTEPQEKVATYKKAKEMVKKLKEGKGDFAGKTACSDCHKPKKAE